MLARQRLQVFDQPVVQRLHHIAVEKSRRVQNHSRLGAEAYEFHRSGITAGPLSDGLLMDNFRFGVAQEKTAARFGY